MDYAFFDQERKRRNYTMDPEYQEFCLIVYNARKALFPGMSDEEFRNYDNAIIEDNEKRGMQNPYVWAWEQKQRI
jgi:hypothetical protein